MQLKLIDSGGREHGGYGAGSGVIINEKYECPCGEGFVYYEKDDTPGFRDRHIYTNCEECDKKYEFHRGTATLKE